MTPDAEHDRKIVPFPQPKARRWRPSHVPERLIEDLFAETPPPAQKRKAG